MLFPHALIPIGIILLLVLIFILDTPRDKLKQNLKQCRISDVRRLKRQQRRQLQREQQDMKHIRDLEAAVTMRSPWEPPILGRIEN